MNHKKRLLAHHAPYWHDVFDKPTQQSNRGSAGVEENSEQPDFDAIIPHSKKLDEGISPSRRHQLFNNDSFRTALLLFFMTLPGSHVVLNSASRQHFVEGMEKEGHLILLSLQGNDIRQLVDFLVSEKWVKKLINEPTKTPRSEIDYPCQETDFTQPHCSTVNSQLRVSSIGSKKPTEKSRSEMLADCEKWLDETVFGCPEYLKRKIEGADGFENFPSESEMLADCEKRLDSLLTNNPGYVKLMEIADVYEYFIGLVAASSRSSSSAAAAAATTTTTSSKP